MSSPRLAIFFTNMITDGITDGTPVGNNGLVQALLCNSASRNILPRMGKTIGLYRDVWIAAIALSRTRLATLTGAMCKTSQCELRSLRVNLGMLNVIRIVT